MLALAGNMVAEQFSSQGIVNYTLFVGVFGMFTLLYLIPASIKEGLAFHPALPFTLDLLNTLFWFCGAVALPSYIGVHSCGNQVSLPTNSIELSVRPVTIVLTQSTRLTSPPTPSPATPPT